MKEFSRGFLVATAAVGLACVGCEHEHHERETVYVQQPAQPQYVVVAQPPPPVVVETRPLPPGPGCIWIDGYWHWGGRQYAWKSGHWEVPPRGYNHWVAPRYERHGNEYHYMPGRWDHDDRR